MTDPKPTDPRDAPVGRLSRLQFWGFLALLLAIFLFATGPLWRDPWKMSGLNLAVLYSYAPIPFLVAAGLAYKKRFSVKALLLDSLELTLLKYAVTFTLALVFWGLAGEPPALVPTGALRPTAAAGPAEPAPRPTPLAAEQTGVIVGTVVDPAGLPRAGALVFVETGLEAYVFEAPATPVELRNDGAAITPRLGAVMLRQPVSARSTDGQLHTLVAEKGSASVFNVPLLGSGAPRELPLAEPHGLVSLRCSVHARSHPEAPAHLAILSHPFHALTGRDGRFALGGVPAGALTLAAFDPEAGVARQSIRLEARATSDLRLALQADEKTAPPARAP